MPSSGLWVRTFDADSAAVVHPELSPAWDFFFHLRVGMQSGLKRLAGIRDSARLVESSRWKACLPHAVPHHIWARKECKSTEPDGLHRYGLSPSSDSHSSISVQRMCGHGSLSPIFFRSCQAAP
jgi:hypothetical protein